MAKDMEGTPTPGEQAREEREIYRGDRLRPLGGYVVLMAAFAGLIAGAGGLVAARGNRLPSGVRVLDVLFLTAGTHKLSRLISKDAVTSPLRVPFTRYKETGGPAEVEEEARRGSQTRRAIGELITCPFCMDLWIATGFTLGMIFAPRFTRLIAMTLSVLAGADFLQLAYARLQQ
ncbi:DUF1360 domain-containing protein [Saccharopolyspora sp. 5N102]|uniref:DUF1360 domain-containing protein n=1 Tax=Saccharopolyspora sp. 5N102 TaxID=3375155 RepID=UPI0037896AAC